MRRELIAHHDPKSPISEIFRTLRTNIQFINTKGRLKSILITSTFPGEGKSWVSSNLAVTFAQAGKKVILIDADMRKGRQYSIFGVSPRPGLSNYLSGVGENNEELTADIKDFIQETEVENLYVISAGNVPPNPSELLVGEQMIELLEKLKEISDIIIIDGTPSQLVTDSLILARLVDSTLIVTAKKETKKEDLKRVINNIKNVGGKIAGVVINKVDIPSKKYEQSYYYGSTSMTTSNKTKNKLNLSKLNFMKNRNEKDEEIDREVLRNRNNERARELVNQNRSKEEQKEEIQQQDNIIQETEKKDYSFDKTADIQQEETMELPKFLKNKAEQNEKNDVENVNVLWQKPNNNTYEQSSNIGLDKNTADILKQVNEYLENQKKEL